MLGISYFSRFIGDIFAWFLSGCLRCLCHTYLLDFMSCVTLSLTASGFRSCLRRGSPRDLCYPPELASACCCAHLAL